MPYDMTMNTKPEPSLGRDVYLAPSSVICGDLVLGDLVTIMPYVVIRADIAPIRVGNRVNFQDSVIVHTPMGVPLEIGDDVGIGHRAIIHCRRIDSHCLIGMGSILLDGCEIGRDCVIAAGAVLAPGTCVPAGSIVMGVPGKVVREVTEKDMQAIDHVVQSYIDLGRLHASGAFPNITPSKPNA